MILPGNENRKGTASHAGKPQPLPQRPLSHSLPLDPNLRDELLTELKKLASATFDRYLPAFTQSLSPFNRAVYTQAAEECRYAEKDWYRNPHDIVVVSAMQGLVNKESLPPWLVTAAILHDRGYGILANGNNPTASEYLQRQGAHWENRDTRLQHARLSTEYAERLVFNTLGNGSPNIIPPEDRELFLAVVEKHDHPLIGDYEALPEVGRHHFDADSLFSISLLSFIKDYLSYCADDKKRAKAEAAGICDEGKRFTPNSLLQARIARYYPEKSDLPPGWLLKETPLNQKALSFTEGGRCYPPHSATARHLTDSFFLDLSACGTLLAERSSISSFLADLEPMVSRQFDTLLRDAKAWAVRRG